MRWPTRILGSITLALAFFGSYTAVSVVIDRDPPVIVESARALTPEVARGGTLDIQYTITRLRSCKATASRFITDSEGTIHVPSAYTVGVRALVDGTSIEGRETYTRSVTVPDAAALGPASYDVRFVYSCNIWQRLVLPIKVEAPTVTFIVTQAPDEPTFPGPLPQELKPFDDGSTPPG